MTLSNEAVEAAARAMCASDPNIRMGDAERIVQQRVNLEWREYIEPATAALTAALPMIRAQVLEEAAKALEDDAKLCDCFAHSESECGCGAWNDYKTVPMERAVALVRALKENHP